MALPYTVVEPAARQGLPYGLFSTFTFRPEGTERWQWGVQFEEEPCGIANTLVDDTCVDGSTFTGFNVRDTSTDPAPQEWNRLTVYEVYKCSPIGNTVERAQDKAVQRLQTSEQTAVEGWLWDRFETAGFEGVALPQLDALAQLERDMGEIYGGLGVLHVPRYTATHLLDAGLIEAKGNRMFSKLGTPVAVGAGYGIGSATVEDGIVLTAAVTGYQTPIYEPGEFPDLFDRGHNDLYGLAARDFLVGYEQCGFRAVKIERS